MVSGSLFLNPRGARDAVANAPHRNGLCARVRCAPAAGAAPLGCGVATSGSGHGGGGDWLRGGVRAGGPVAAGAPPTGVRAGNAWPSARRRAPPFPPPSGAALAAPAGRPRRRLVLPGRGPPGVAGWEQEGGSRRWGASSPLSHRWRARAGGPGGGAPWGCQHRWCFIVVRRCGPVPLLLAHRVARLTTIQGRRIAVVTRRTRGAPELAVVQAMLGRCVSC